MEKLAEKKNNNNSFFLLREKKKKLNAEIVEGAAVAVTEFSVKADNFILLVYFPENTFLRYIF